MQRHVLNRMKERMRKRSGERAFHAIGQFHAIGTESLDWSGVRDVCQICEQPVNRIESGWSELRMESECGYKKLEIDRSV